MAGDQVRFSLGNSLKELERLSEHLEIAGNRWHLSPQIILQLNLALDELFTNIVNHSFDSTSQQRVDLTLEYSEGNIIITMIDGGPAFDLTKSADPDLDLPVGKRDIGGLGIFLARRYMDKISYTREKEQNILTMIKKTP